MYINRLIRYNIKINGFAKILMDYLLFDFWHIYHYERLNICF